MKEIHQGYHSQQTSSLTPSLMRWAVKQTVFVFILAAALFLSAGQSGWSAGWVYLGLVALIQVVTALLLLPRSPELLVERSQLHGGMKGWDVALAVLMGYSTVFIAIAAGLEVRFSVSAPQPGALQAFAILVAMAGTLLTLWAMTANPFFSGIVRIQKERGHKVASTGPYQYIRHPGYAGMLVFTLASPFILVSLWAFTPVGFVLGVTVLRTILEDSVLQKELAGYAEYARRVRCRLLPGIW